MPNIDDYPAGTPVAAVRLLGFDPTDTTEDPDGTTEIYDLTGLQTFFLTGPAPAGFQVSWAQITGAPSVPTTPGDIGAAPTSHTHTLSQISDAGTAAGSAVTDFATAAQGALAATALQTVEGTNLTFDQASGLLSIATGTGVTLPEATDAQPGLMSAADKAVIDGLPPGGAAPVRLGINDQPGASYTLTAEDEGRVTRMTSAAANSVMVPISASTPIPIGALFPLRQAGAGQTTIVAAPGVTINSAAGLRLRAQNSSAMIQYVGADVWDLSGDTVV